MNWLSRKKVKKRLGISESILNALIRSGLLGYTLSNMVSNQAVLQYERFGTQWTVDERYGPSRRVMDDKIYENLPEIEGIGPQPPATQNHGMITPPDSSPNILDDIRRTDVGWIAHFYLFPNYFYFPNTTELTLVWPPPLRLSEARSVPGADLPVTLYPDPSGKLGLVVVEGLESPVMDAQGEAYNVAIPLLDELSARYDVPLPVAHSMTVGVPSGVIHLGFPRRSKTKELTSEAELLPRCPHRELRDAYALYREAVSSNNPFHAFLSFWKVYEEAVYVRKGWGVKHKRSDTRIREEIFPDLFAFGAKPEELDPPVEDPEEVQEMLKDQLRGKPFESAKKSLKGPYRIALAHAGDVRSGKPLTGASYEDYQKVAAKVPIVRYMANVVLENVRATFDAETKRENGEVTEERC